MVQSDQCIKRLDRDRKEDALRSIDHPVVDRNLVPVQLRFNTFLLDLLLDINST